LIDLYYRGSPFELLRAVYDDFEFKPWLFKSVGPTYWVEVIDLFFVVLSEMISNFARIPSKISGCS